MIYTVLIIAAVAILIVGISSRQTAREMLLFIGVVLSYTVMIFLFLLYLCKDAFHLNILLEYFPLPRQFVLTFFSIGIAKPTILSLLNLSATVFIFFNLLFTVNTVTKSKSKLRYILLTIALVYSVCQGILLNPYIYKILYSSLYPSNISAKGFEQLFSGISDACNMLNSIILVICAVSLIVVTLKSPKVKILKLSYLSVSLSYTMLVLSYIFFFRSLPGYFVRYSKIADTFTYSELVTTSQLETYRYFPYILLVFFLLFSASVLYLSFTKWKLENNNMEITRNIRAGNVSSRLFCHYMKNEILAITAEIETMPVNNESREAIENILERCDIIYKKLDGIHNSIRDNTMNIRQVPADECIISALEYVKTSNRLEGVTVEFKCDNDLPYILVDPVYFEQALIEMFYNAADAMLNSEKKELTVTATKSLKWTTIAISDTGHGIEKKNLTNIFTPLFSTNAMSKNWGIGLSMAHRIITGFDGRIDLHSQVGQGTRFEILLPLTKTSSNPAQISVKERKPT